MTHQVKPRKIAFNIEVYVQHWNLQLCAANMFIPMQNKTKRLEYVTMIDKG